MQPTTTIPSQVQEHSLFKENYMAHFARLDDNNTVIEVLVVDNKDINDLPFPESEAIGIEYLTNIFPNTMWVQTSYNNNFRIRYAGVGSTFVPHYGEHGGFTLTKERDYFIFDLPSCNWIPPVPYPQDGILYRWNHEEFKWTPVTGRAPKTITIG